MAEILSSRANPRVRAWKSLQSDARERRRRRRVLLEGVHLVTTYIERVGAPRELIVSNTALANTEIATLAKRVGLQPVIVSRAVFAAFANTENPAGIAAEVDLPGGDPDLSGSRHCVLIEGVQDAGNLGAILRSAAAFGVDSVVIGSGSADPWSPKVLRAAMGGHFFLRIAEVSNLAPKMSEFSGLKVCTVPQGGKSLAQLDLTGPVAWIFGSEGGGISASLQESADVHVQIPMPGGTESLNVAAAAAICFYERSRQLARVEREQIDMPVVRS
jgi:TrmH family RNA methyltransferase